MGFWRHMFIQIAIVLGAIIAARALTGAGLPRGVAIGVGAALAGGAIWFFIYRHMRREQARVEAMPPAEATAYKARRRRPALIAAPVGVLVFGAVAVTAQTPQAILMFILYTAFTVWLLRQFWQEGRR